jgi:hypothetical protein
MLESADQPRVDDVDRRKGWSHPLQQGERDILRFSWLGRRMSQGEGHGNGGGRSIPDTTNTRSS